MLSCYPGRLMANGGSSQILREVIGVITTVRFYLEKKDGRLRC